jgi:hypothetical protein
MSQPNNIQLIQQEGQIALAIDTIQKGYFTSTRTAAKLYKVLYTTFQNCINRQFVQYDLQPPNCKLTNTEESILV